MYAFLIVIHVIAALFLIAVILLQAGRGGGLADSFGGSQLQSLFGTRSTTILTRLTTICAIAFIVTCLTLAIISSRRAKSIVDKVAIPEPVTDVVAPFMEQEEYPVEEEEVVAPSFDSAQDRFMEQEEEPVEEQVPAEAQ